MTTDGPTEIALLTGGDGWHVRDLQRAAALLGHNSRLIDFRQLHAHVAIENHPLTNFDALLVRTMPLGSLEQVVFRMDVLHRLQARGLVVVNPPRTLELCIDKYLTTALLEGAGLPVPPTIVCQDSETALEAFEKLGGDVVVKPLFGSEGRGMMRITDRELAWRAFRTLERTQNVLYLQQFVPHEGYDLRVFVLGGRVLTAMRRFSEDWRVNVAQGAKAEAVRLSSQQEKLALKAAEALQIPIAGVDLLPGRDGVEYVLELNAVPGWRKLSAVTGVGVATETIRFVQQQCDSA